MTEFQLDRIMALTNVVRKELRNYEHLVKIVAGDRPGNYLIEVHIPQQPEDNR